MSIVLSNTTENDLQEQFATLQAELLAAQKDRDDAFAAMDAMGVDLMEAKTNLAVREQVVENLTGTIALMRTAGMQTTVREIAPETTNEQTQEGEDLASGEDDGEGNTPEESQLAELRATHTEELEDLHRLIDHLESKSQDLSMIKRELEAKLSQRDQEIESLMAILQAQAEFPEFEELPEAEEELPEAEEELPEAAEELVL